MFKAIIIAVGLTDPEAFNVIDHHIAARVYELSCRDSFGTISPEAYGVTKMQMRTYFKHQKHIAKISEVSEIIKNDGCQTLSKQIVDIGVL